MSYAIVRNEKLTRSQAQGICVHNDRKAKNHSNKEIDISKTHLNYYLKKYELNYIKEFDKLKEENNLKGQIRSNSIIICEMIFTSDKEFFENDNGLPLVERMEAIKKMAHVEEIYRTFPHLDCGSCGAPNCHALAEDIVNGEAKETDCLIKLRETFNKS